MQQGLLVPATVGLFALSAALVSGAIAVQNIGKNWFAPSVHVDAQSFSWLAQVPLSLEKNAATIAQSDLASSAQPLTINVKRRSLALWHPTKRAPRRVRLARKAVTPALADRPIIVSQAAAIEVAAPVKAEVNEMLKMQEIWRYLSSQAQAQKEKLRTDRQAALARLDEPLQMARLDVAPANLASLASVVRTQISKPVTPPPFKRVTTHAKKPPAPKKALEAKTVAASPAPKKLKKSAIFAVTTQAIVTNHRVDPPKPPVPSPQVIQAKAPEPQPQTQPQLTAALKPVEARPLPMPAERVVAAAPAPEQPAPIEQAAPAVAEADYSKLKEIAAQGVTTQLTTQSAHPEKPPTVDLSKLIKDIEQVSPKPTPEPQPSPSPVLKHEAPTFVEAFSSYAVEVGGAEASPFSKERATSGEKVGWQVVHAPAHRPALYWEAEFDVGPWSVPMISTNTEKLLGFYAEALPQANTGIVFGYIAAGWGVSLSGRAEKIVYLSPKDLKVLTDDANQEERWFVLMNAEPGMQLAQLTNLKGQASAAVALPVMAGAATYANLTKIDTVTVTGAVRAIGQSAPQSVRRSQVRVVGQPKATMTAKAGGRFSLPNAQVVGNYPLYLETDASQGYTHRYRAFRSELGHLTLFRIASAQLDEWVSHLEGGVSPDSGLVMAALPTLAGDTEQGPLFPSVQSVLFSSPLRPETYTLSGQGELMVNTPLRPEAFRFLGVQVSEGPAMVHVENQSQQTVWSELIVSSPGVINLIGPY